MPVPQPVTRPNTVAEVWRGARPGQWVKNLVVFAPLLFSAGASWDPADGAQALSLFLRAAAAFALLALAASGGYLLNDATDAEADRVHPTKRGRPVAAGRLSATTARIAGGALLIAPLVLAAALGGDLVAAIAAYEAVTLAYTVRLRRYAGLDVIALSAAFALRAVAGAEAIAVPVSGWIVACTALGAAYVVLVKRAQEEQLLATRAAMHRAALRAYARIGAGRLAALVGWVTVGAYAAYALTAPNLPPNHAMLLTVPCVAYGLVRYRQVAERRPDRNADELVVRDLPLIASIALFAVVAFFVLAV
jgi:4-hydroxybenzoate polyprenyltransferase